MIYKILAEIPRVQIDEEQPHMWQGIKITCQGLRAQVQEVDLTQHPDIECWVRQSVRVLKSEETVRQGLFISEEHGPLRIVLLTGIWGYPSLNEPMQAAFRLNGNDNEVLIRGSIGTRVIEDRPCGPGYNLRSGRYLGLNISREDDNLVLERTKRQR